MRASFGEFVQESPTLWRCKLPDVSDQSREVTLLKHATGDWYLTHYVGDSPMTFSGSTPEEAIEEFEEVLREFESCGWGAEELSTSLGVFRGGPEVWTLRRSGVRAQLQLVKDWTILIAYWEFSFDGLNVVIGEDVTISTPEDAITATLEAMAPYLVMVDNFRAFQAGAPKLQPVEGAPWYDRVLGV